MTETFDSFEIGDSGEENLSQASGKTMHTITASYPYSAIITERHRTLVLSSYSSTTHQPSSIGPLIAFAEANDAIEAKAATLGSLAGSPLGDTISVPGGYMRSYQGCDIYYSKADGAHEVHGDIRAKYNALGDATGMLGIPVTDESATPDGFGRFNHFNKGGSIYWTPTTGPMMVRSVIRNLWASQGWERSPMGYPVADEYRLPPFNAVQDHPDIAWSFFQNGAILSNGDQAANTVTANVSPDNLKSLIRTFFDRGFKKKDSAIGLQAPVDIVSISNWGYGFWASTSRTITYRLHGFVDLSKEVNPSITAPIINLAAEVVPDPTFQLEIQLDFGLTWPQTFLYPMSKTLVATLRSLSVTATAVIKLLSNAVSKSIFDGVNQTFHRGGPDPEHPEVEDGSVFITSFPTGVDQRGSGNIDVLDVQTTSQGGLQVLLNPLPQVAGAFRQEVVQQRIDTFLENF